MRLEKILSHGVVRPARHDVPRHHRAVELMGFAELFGEKLKKGFAAQRGGDERPFGIVPAEPGTLPSGYGKGRDLTLADERLPECAGAGVNRLVLRYDRVVGRGCDGFGGAKVGFLPDVRLGQLAEVVPVERPELRRKRPLLTW